MRVKQLMSRDPACCLPSDTACKAAAVMMKNKAALVPVVKNSDTKTLVGVVTGHDLCFRVIAQGHNPQQVRVRDCMTSNAVCCELNDTLDYAMRLMRENQIRRIVVVDGYQRVRGLVSLAVR